jgi:serine phosphatase RsbU (regulator of sigma subunit)
MSPRALRCLLLLATLFGGAAGAIAQEPTPATLDAGSFADPEGLQFTFAWRFRAGDDPDWAEPALDDSGWELVDPLMPPGKLPAGGWHGVGWFRRHLIVESAGWGRRLAIRLTAAGAAEVYLDGRLVGSAGTFVPNATLEVPPARHGPWPMVFSARPDHVIAVRYACNAPTAAPAPASGIGFTLSIVPAGTMVAAARRDVELLGPLAIVLVFVTLLHLTLFAFYPRLRENLFYALNMAVLALIVFRDYGNAQVPRPAWVDALSRLAAPAPTLAVLFGLLTYYAVRTRPFPRTWKPFTVAAVVLMPAVYFSPDPYATLLWCAYLAVMVGEIIRVESSGKTVQREGVTVLLVGLALLAGFVGLQVLINFRLVPAVAGISAVYTLGVLAAVVTMSLFLAGTFARTSLHLERRLAQVETLSAQVLEQERAAHAAELHAQLVEAESARQSRELEAARSLQLSMLPAILPAVEGLEVAVSMTTASEVGGDYYDFRSGGDGSLLAAVGDATGHGAAAGIMVTAVKALFSTLAGQPSLATILGECDRVLRGMNVHPHHMCLALARVCRDAAVVCSAAMPPVLHYRAASGAVEEIGTGSLPLGGRLAPAYEERRVALAPGDTLLLASDGFAEVLDPTGGPLGFDGASEAFRRAAGGPAQQVVDSLGAAVAAWRGEREQTDDVTFVVIRVQP